MNAFYLVASISTIDANQVMYVSLLAGFSQSIHEFYLN
jgi:hypothetical protein